MDNPAPAKGAGRGEIELIARGVWVHGGRVLLCRNKERGYAFLPGGHIEVAESAGQALEREFLEETGQPVVAGPLLLVTEGAFQTRKRWHHEINLVFHVERSKAGSGSKPPAVRSREPEIAFDWVDLAAAVDLDIRPLAIKAWLAAGMPRGDGGAEWVSEMGGAAGNAAGG